MKYPTIYFAIHPALILTLIFIETRQNCNGLISFSTSESTPEQVRRLLGAEGLLNDDAPGPHPSIVGMEPPYALTIQGEHVATFDTEEEAVVGLAMSHMVFHTKYPKKFTAYLAYIERYILQIDDGTKVPRRVLSFIQNRKK